MEMEIEDYKCSLKKHKEIEAISYCQICKIYMCQKCNKAHSDLCESHIPYNLKEDSKAIFTGICKIKNHSNELEYFCKTHNELCCASCITKIKGEGNGQHTDCEICFIKNIENSKKDKLKNNINYLESLSKNIDNSIIKLKKMFEKMQSKKEELIINIQKIFSKIRNAINEREDKILLELNKKFEELYFNENLIKEGEKLPTKIKNAIQEGKLIQNYDKNNFNLKNIINTCINIENNINKINIINNNISKYYNTNKEIKFKPDDNRLDELIYSIEKFGSIFIFDNDSEIKSIINNFKLAKKPIMINSNSVKSLWRRNKYYGFNISPKKNISFSKTFSNSDIKTTLIHKNFNNRNYLNNEKKIISNNDKNTKVLNNFQIKNKVSKYNKVKNEKNANYKKYSNRKNENDFMFGFFTKKKE